MTRVSIWLWILPCAGALRLVPGTQWRISMNFGSMLTCNRLDEWISPEADIHQGLRVKRSIEPSRWQPVADKLYKKYGDRQKLIQERVVNLGEPKALLQELFEEA